MSIQEYNNPLLSIRNLETNFKVKDVTIKAVNNVSIDINKNTVLALVGETGCGKSVLGLSILRLLPQNASSTGHIYFNNVDLLLTGEKYMQKLRGKKIGMIPQNPATSLNPLMKIGKQVMEVIQLHKRAKKKEAKQEVIDLFTDLQLPNPTSKIKSYPHELSGGMNQRVLVSMGIACNPNLIIVDEPTKGLDAVLKKEVVNMLKNQNSINGSSMLLITHDFAVAASLADNIAVMYAGEIVETGSAREILESPVHPYTLSLINSLPSKGLNPIPGFSPSLSNLPNGCSFEPRCKFATSSCANNHPDLFKNNESHYVRCFNAARS